ncbi:hypothetical protein PM082_020230 [Marasmius tenuissimus]|nr:hypothetical protein PM082_020230 [Marasmius tenuissimus]
MMADVAACLSQVTSIFAGLKIRVGADAVTLVVKNRPEKIMNPQWICTDQRILHYLPTVVRGWNTAVIAKQVEALCVAGCDPTKLIKNAKDRVEALKKECTQLILDSLNEACLTKELGMQYKRFDTLITANYQVVCEGWPKGLTFQGPSDFGGNQDNLITLRDAWRDGTATFRRLSDDEFVAWKAARAKGLEEGTIVPKVRQKRSDAGMKRGKKGKSKDTEDGDESSDDEEEDEGEWEDDDDEPAVTTIKKSAKRDSAKKKPAKKALVEHTQKTPAKKQPVTKKKPAASKTKPTAPSEEADSNDVTQGTAFPLDSSPLPRSESLAARPYPKPRRLPSAAERAQIQLLPVETPLSLPPPDPSPASPASPASTSGPVGPVGDVQESGSHANTSDSSPMPAVGVAHVDIDAAASTPVQIDDSVIDPQLHELPSIQTLEADPHSGSDLPCPMSQPPPMEPQSSDQSLLPAHRSNSSVSHQNSDRGIKRKSQSPDCDSTEDRPVENTRPQRNRAPPKRKHLGASTHPASRRRLNPGEGSEDDAEG